MPVMNRRIVPVLFVSLLVLAGCGKEEKEENPQLKPSVRVELSSSVKASIADLKTIREGLQGFFADLKRGQAPNAVALDALVKKMDAVELRLRNRLATLLNESATNSAARTLHPILSRIVTELVQARLELERQGKLLAIALRSVPPEKFEDLAAKVHSLSEELKAHFPLP